jgi:microcystin-dependent protein
MAEPLIGEIRIMSFGFAPKGWALCNGQLMAINQNQALFSLLGTTYGGNGQNNFALPNLQGRVPIHVGNGHSQGETAGSTSVTITQQTMAQHLHFAQGTTADAGAPVANNNLLSKANNMYQSPNSGGLVPLNPAAITPVGGSQPHNNMMPTLVLNFCIALLGIFPSRN